jgi:hypothetical protein
MLDGEENRELTCQKLCMFIDALFSSKAVKQSPRVCTLARTVQVYALQGQGLSTKYTHLRGSKSLKFIKCKVSVYLALLCVHDGSLLLCRWRPTNARAVLLGNAQSTGSMSPCSERLRVCVFDRKRCDPEAFGTRSRGPR